MFTYLKNQVYYNTGVKHARRNCNCEMQKEVKMKKLGSIMLRAVTEDQRFASLRGILGTKDAHGFYEHFGFEKNDKLFMQRWTKVFK